MTFKARTQPSDITRPLTFDLPPFKGWQVDVRYVSPTRFRQLTERATANGQFNADDFNALYVAECVTGWQGLTSDMLAALVEFEAGSEQPSANGDGTIPFTPTLAQFLWTAAPAERFQNPIFRLSQDLLRIAALEKKSGSAPSSG